MTRARQGVYMDPASGQLMARAQAAAQQPGMRTPGGVPYPDHASRAVELQTLAEVHSLNLSALCHFDIKQNCCALTIECVSHGTFSSWGR